MSLTLNEEQTPAPAAHKDRIMYAAEVAERIRRSVAQVRWMEHNSTGPKSALLGGRRVWRESDVEAWISAAFEEAS